MPPKTIDIVLATYNGAGYLPQFLNSLKAQEDQAFCLRVRDDGSTDATRDILAAYGSSFGDRMILSDDHSPSGSAKGNFSRLMTTAEADYVLWADQDDVWKPNRISVTRALLDDSAHATGADTPAFVFSDVTPTDVQLDPLSPSYFSFKKLAPERVVSNLAQSLVCTPMLGCAAGINRALLDLALPVPVDEVTGHDWWALLLAVAAGDVRVSRASTVLYRLHGSNVSGQVENSLRQHMSTGNKAAKVRRGMMLRWRQARAVRDRLVDRGLMAPLEVIDAFLDIEDMSFARRRLALWRGGYVYPDMTRTAAMLALC